MLYLMSAFVLLGIILDKIIVQLFPDSNPVELLNGLALYYFGFEILIRFFIQPTSAMNLTPFMHLPVGRSFLMHLLLARSIVNPVNYISLLIFVPFAIRSVSALYSGAAACWWLLALLAFIVFVTCISVYIKRQMRVKPLATLCCGLLFVALMASDIWGIFSLSEISATTFGAVLTQPAWILAPVILVAGVYLLNYRFLMTNFYLEEIDRKIRKGRASVQTLGFMSRFGLIGELMRMELKLIIRHKRSKYMVFTGLLFTILFGFYAYMKPVLKHDLLFLIGIGIWITGGAMFTYGEKIFAWEGKFFDGILTRRGNLFDFFCAKYYLLISFSLCNYILTVPFLLFGVRTFWTQSACFLYNIGFSSFYYLWSGQFNRKRIDLSQKMAFNYQGTNVSQFMAAFPILLLPLLIGFIFNRLDLYYWGLGLIAMVGIIGFLCRKWILRFIFRRFDRKKYLLAEGYRRN